MKGFMEREKLREDKERGKVREKDKERVTQNFT